MSRANPQAVIVSEEQLVPSANILIIKKNNQRVASDSNIIDTLLRLVVGILRHHKLYKLVSLIATVPVIYLHQFWTSITHNSNNHTFNFQLDTQNFTSARLLRTVLQMPPPDANKPYTKPPIGKQIMAFIKKLRYDEDPNAKMSFVLTFVATKLHQQWRAILSVLNRSLTGKDTSWDTARFPILQILWGIVHSANLDYASLIWDEFEWQAVDRTTRQTKISDAEMHSEGQDSPLTKLMNTIEGKFKFGMEIADIMINDAIKQSAGYKYYKHKRNKSEKAKAAEEPKEQHVSPVRSRKGKGYVRSSTQEANVPSAFKKNDVPKKARSLTMADNIVKETVAVNLAKFVSIEEQRLQQRKIMTQLIIDIHIEKDVEDTYAEWGQKLKGHAVEDLAVQSLLDLGKGSKQADLRFEYISVIDSDAARDSLCLDIDEEKDDENDDSDNFDMDLFADEPQGDDDAAGFGVFMYNKSIEPLKSTYLSPTVTCSSLEYI
ncbi:hypothetical protein Tco_0429401 [Tanacetum coccineum]